MEIKLDKFDDDSWCIRLYPKPGPDGAIVYTFTVDGWQEGLDPPQMFVWDNADIEEAKTALRQLAEKAEQLAEEDLRNHANRANP